MPEKKDKEKNQLAQLCSQIVFVMFLGGLQECYLCWNPYKIGVSAYFEKEKKGPKCEKGWVKNLSKHVAQHNWTDFWLKKWYFLSSFSFVFWKISFSLQKEEY